MKKTVLFLFTATYPSSNTWEYPRIESEIPHLLDQFDQIIILPSVVEGESRPLLKGVKCERTLAAALKKNHRIMLPNRILQGIRSSLFWKEYFSKFPITGHPKSVKRSSVWNAEALITAKWAEDYLKENKIGLQNCLFYTYWFETVATGIGWLKTRYPNLKLVSRAHGYDLYEERFSPAYIPFRKESLGALDRLFINSDYGNKYLSHKYPQYIAKFETALMGVCSTGKKNNPSPDRICRIVSCSNIVLVKRVDLLCEGLLHLASLYPTQIFEWNHFGDGPLMSKLTTLIQNSPTNLTIRLWGQTPNERILVYYTENPIDLFINTSSSEGVPVSIMEAQSFGIPVIAPQVGGIPEIVSYQNGYLLDPNPSPSEIAQAVWEMYTSPDITLKRRASLQNWQKKFNAKVNYQDFARQIRAVIDTSPIDR